MRVVLLLWFALLVSPAWAIDFERVLVDVNGRTVCMDEAIKDNCPPDKVFTLKQAARTALVMVFEDERSLAAVEKFRRGELAMALGSGTTSFKVEDIKLMKDLIGKAYGPIVVVQAWKELDPNAAAK